MSDFTDTIPVGYCVLLFVYEEHRYKVTVEIKGQQNLMQAQAAYDAVHPNGSADEILFHSGDCVYFGN